jgi:hypothetical protein
MWTEVMFEGAKASRGLEMVARLQLDGLVLNQDFDWRYINNAHELRESGENVSQVIIGFRDPVQATFYSLKWQR